MIAASVRDYRALARRRLPRFLFEYIDGGAYAETTLHRNEADLAAVRLRQRVLCDVSHIDLTANLFDERFSLPVALGPIGLAGMNARRGEVQAARAAAEAGVAFTLSTVGACSLQEVAAQAARPLWFQLYMIRDRGFMESLLDRARAFGCSTLIFTVDMPAPGVRYRDVRSGLTGEASWARELRRFADALAHPGWAWDVGVWGRPHTLGNVAPVLAGRSGMDDFLAWMRENFDPSVTWRDLEWVRGRWKGPLVIKGIMEADDALRAAQSGADGIVVSNHGGRQLDGVRSSAEALPAIVEALDGRPIKIMADGGVRSGLDVIRMLALGADLVLLGRAWAYALAGGGQRGVRHMLQIIEDEMRVAMALTGFTNISDINASILDKTHSARGAREFSMSE